MSKQVKVEGKLISVPDDATPDEIDQIANPKGNPNVNPSDSIPKATRPHVPGLDPEPDNFITSPNGLIRTGVRQVGRGIAAMSRPGLDAKLGAGSDIVRGAMTAATPAAIPFMAANPLVSAARLGLGTGAQYLGEKGSQAAGLGPGASALIGDTAGIGAGGASFLGKPSAIIKGAGQGAKAALTDSIPITRYGHTLNVPKPLAGMAAGEAMGYGFHALTPHAPEIGAGLGAVAPVIKGAYEGGKAGLAEYKAAQRVPISRSPQTISDVPETPDMPVGPTTKPVLPSGRRVPTAGAETRPVQAVSGKGAQASSVEANAPRPSQRNVIYDENNNPVAYDDPNNPYQGSGTIRPVQSRSNAYSDDGEGMKPGTEAPDRNLPAEERRAPKPLPSAGELHEQRTDQYRPSDIHDQVAMEGIQKRAADSRAKYEDVYQNVIKGQYTPEQLRNMTPELQTELDMKIKNMKRDGKKKYGTGLNPAVTESLASRLESENQ